jgi:hypothetical protein
MKRIRKFESFSNHRMPTKVTEDEWNRKWKIHGLEKLTEIEKEFFRQKFRTYIEYIGDSLVQLEIPNIRYSNMVKVDIVKLKDDWYLIEETCDDGDVEFYICDEWDEVIGYLSNIKSF